MARAIGSRAGPALVWRSPNVWHNSTAEPYMLPTPGTAGCRSKSRFRFRLKVRPRHKAASFRCLRVLRCGNGRRTEISAPIERWCLWADQISRSEEHTSELQSHVNLVCRLLLEK